MQKKEQNYMIVRINGQEVQGVKRLEIKEGASNKQAIAAVAAGIIACIIWWSIWA
ncbi:hypothetical protein D3C76_1740410 [compost metagenome]